MFYSVNFEGVCPCCIFLSPLCLLFFLLLPHFVSGILKDGSGAVVTKASGVIEIPNLADENDHDELEVGAVDM